MEAVKLQTTYHMCLNYLHIYRKSCSNCVLFIINQESIQINYSFKCLYQHQSIYLCMHYYINVDMRGYYITLNDTNYIEIILNLIIFVYL